MVQFHHMQPIPRNASLILTFWYTAAVHDDITYIRHTTYIWDETNHVSEFIKRNV